MKKLNILGSFKDKKFKYGGYATLMTAVVLAILIVINLVVDQIPWKKDLTQNRLYSISDQTYKVLDGLKQDVKIIGLYQAGKQNPSVDEILKKYTDYSKKLSVEYVDPVKNPAFAKQYDKEGKGLSDGSLIVTSGSKFKVIGPSDLYNYNYNNSYQPQVESFNAEQKLTGAIMYVTSDKLPIVYTLKGHGEIDLPYSIKSQLETENYEIKDLNLTTEESVPADASAIIITSPKRDITQDEDKKIRDYLSNSGHAIFLMDLLKNELPNTEAILKSYGIGLQHSLIVEEDRSHNAGNPVYLIPKMEKHDIMSPLESNDMMVVMPGVQGIETLDMKKRSLEIEPLLTTTDTAYAKVNLDTKTMDKEAGDLNGPFNIGVAVTDKSGDADVKDTKLVVFGGSAFLSDQLSQSIPGNGNMLLNSMNWLQDKTESISIRPKRLGYSRLNISGLQSLILSGIVVIVIPVIIFVLGLSVWLRRRHL